MEASGKAVVLLCNTNDGLHAFDIYGEIILGVFSLPLAFGIGFGFV